MPKKRRGRPRAPVITYQTYIFRIAGWEPHYSFALGNERLDHGPYSEYVELVLSGEFLAPAKTVGRVGKLMFLGDREHKRTLEVPTQSDWKPLGVGSVTVRGDRAEFLGSLPYDALWGLICGLAARTLQFVDMHGERLRYGRARIRSFTFCRQMDPDDLEDAREQR